MHQVVGSHNCDGASSDHKPLEDIGVELPPLTAAVIQALHCVTQQGLVLMKRGGHTTCSMSLLEVLQSHVTVLNSISNIILLRWFLETISLS